MVKEPSAVSPFPLSKSTVGIKCSRMFLDAADFVHRANIVQRDLRTFAPKSSYGEIFFISPLELGHKVLTPKMKKKMGVTDFVSEKMAVEKCLNFDRSVIIRTCSLLC